MKLHGLARVKNEGDVIEEFVRHNLRFLDALTIVDNSSFDGTLAVLEALRAEGLPIAIVHDPLLAKRQYETMTRAARRSAEEADWDFLFLLDADEFVKARDRGQLERSLRALAPGQNGLIPWLSYVPTKDDDERDTRVLSRLKYRRTIEARPAIHKCVLSRAFAKNGDFRIDQGNHAAFDARGEVRAVMLTGASLAHYPVRSVVQIQTKVLLGWGAYLAMGYDSDGYGWHQRRLFHRLESNAAWSMDDLYDIATRYTEVEATPGQSGLTYDPLPPVPVRYGNAAVANPTQLAAMYVRQLAGAIAECEATARKPQPAAIDR